MRMPLIWTTRSRRSGCTVQVNATQSLGVCQAAGAAIGLERGRHQSPSDRNFLGSATASGPRTNLSDEEVDDICAGLPQTPPRCGT
jgi:hypothetical protein